MRPHNVNVAAITELCGWNTDVVLGLGRCSDNIVAYCRIGSTRGRQAWGRSCRTGSKRADELFVWSWVLVPRMGKAREVDGSDVAFDSHCAMSWYGWYGTPT